LVQEGLYKPQVQPLEALEALLHLVRYCLPLVALLVNMVVLPHQEVLEQPLVI
jgi:hypothetical protein